jgi:hypothetical protein
MIEVSGKQWRQKPVIMKRCLTEIREKYLYPAKGPHTRASLSADCWSAERSITEFFGSKIYHFQASLS